MRSRLFVHGWRPSKLLRRARNLFPLIYEGYGKIAPDQRAVVSSMRRPPLFHETQHLDARPTRDQDRGLPRRRHDRPQELCRSSGAFRSNSRRLGGRP